MNELVDGVLVRLQPPAQRFAKRTPEGRLFGCLDLARIETPTGRVFRKVLPGKREVRSEHEYTSPSIILRLDTVPVLFRGCFAKSLCKQGIRRAKLPSLAVKDHDIAGAFEMDASSRVRNQVAMSAGLGASSEVQSTVQPEAIDRSGVRVRIGSSRTDPIALGTFKVGR